MPVSTESANLVRQKVMTFPTRDPAVHLLLDAFFRYWSEHKSNQDLEYFAFSALADDTVAVDAANTLFVVYFRKQNTTVDAYPKVFDDATATGTAADERITTFLADGNDDQVLIFPDGMPMAAGIVLTSHTTSSGTTDSGAADGPAGFLVWGADGI